MSAAAQVLSLPELLEPILNYVAALIEKDSSSDRNSRRLKKDVLALLQWQRLGSTWYEIIRASAPIQAALFLRSCLHTDIDWTRHSIVASRNPSQPPLVNPLASNVLKMSHLLELSLRGVGPAYPLVLRISRRDVRFLSEHPGSWQGMYFSQPPIKRLDWDKSIPPAVKGRSPTFWAMGGLTIGQLHRDLLALFTEESKLEEVWLLAEAGQETKRLTH